MGDRKKNLQTAALLIGETIGPIVKSSQIYETDAWGNRDQPSFYNQVHIIKSPLSAEELMTHILLIEAQMGRIRTIKNAARIIDIDILFFNEEIINLPHVIVPHTQIPYRRFVLTPLDELAPGFIHPVYKQTIHELLLKCKDPLQVVPLR